MKNIEVVMSAIRENIEDCLSYAEKHLEIKLTSYAQLVDEVYDGNRQSFKDDVLHIINRIDNDLNKDNSMMDDGSIELENGEITSYRRVVYKVRKEYFKNTLMSI